MKRILMLAALVVAAPAHAQQLPHLEFVRGLRSRGHPDLALEYLRQLEKLPGLPPEVRALLPLEVARTQVETAERASDPEYRRQLVQDALAEFERFVGSPANQKNPLIADAHLEIGRLISEQGRARAVETREAHRRRDYAETKSLGNQTIALLDRSAKSLQLARDRLEPRLNALDATDPKQKGERLRLLESFLTTQLLRGQLLYEKADIADLIADSLRQNKEAGESTFRALAAKSAQEASRVFDDVAGRRAEHPLGWIGQAWYGRSQDGVDDSRRDAAWKQVESSKLDAARPAQRLVAYFRILSEVRRDPSPQAAKEREARQQRLEAWLRLYTGAAAPFTKPPTSLEGRRVFDGPEGQHIRYLLSASYRDELMAIRPELRDQPRFRRLYEQTMALLVNLEALGGDYAGAARNVRFQVRRLDGQLLTVDVASLDTFDDLLLRAIVENERAREVLRKSEGSQDEAEKKQLQAQAAQHVTNMLAALRRGLRRMPDTAGSTEREQLWSLFFTGYLQQQDFERAVVVLDYLSRDPRCRPAMAQEAAERALDIYRRMVNFHRTQPALANADTRQLVRVAELIVERWKDAPSADEARFMLGHIYQGQRRFRQAAEHWGAVSPRSPNHGEASYLAGDLYWRLHVTLVLYPEDPKDKKPITTPTPELNTAITLLNRSLSWFAAQKPDPKKPKTQPDPRLPVLASMRLAQVYSYLNQPAEVVRLADPLVTRLAANQLPKDLPEGTAGDLLSLSLRAHVQMKNIERARAVLKILQTQGAQGQLGDSFSRIVSEMGNQLQAQITALEAQGPSAEAQLKATKDSFRSFLAQIRGDKNLDQDMIVWVGSSYMGMGDYAEAARVFATAKWPGPAPKLMGNEKPEEREKVLAQIDAHEKQAAHFRRCLLLRVTALRRAGVTAADPADKARFFTEAQQAFNEGTAAAGLKNHPQFIQEEILILQDQGLVSGPQGAITRWDQLRTALQPHASQGGLLRDVYLEACYNLVVCKFIEAKQLPEETDRKNALRRTAELYLVFSRNADLQPRLEKFLEEPAQADLRKEVQELTKR